MDKLSLSALPTDVLTVILGFLPVVGLMQFAMAARAAPSQLIHLRRLSIRYSRAFLLEAFLHYINKCEGRFGPLLQSVASLDIKTNSSELAVSFSELVLRHSTFLSALTLHRAYEALPVSRLSLTRLRELNLVDCVFSSHESFLLADVLCSAPQLSVFRSVNAICGLHRDLSLTRRLSLEEANGLQQKLIKGLTQLSVLTFTVNGSRLSSPVTSFAHLTRLQSLAVDFEDFEFVEYTDDMLSFESAMKMLSCLRGLYPPQLRAEPPRLCSAIKGTPSATSFTTPLHLAARVLKDMSGWIRAWQSLGFSIDVEDSNGGTPLMRLLQENRRTKIVAPQLISAGADISHRARGWHNRHALFSAVAGGDKAAASVVFPYFKERYETGVDASLFLDSLGRNLVGVGAKSANFSSLLDLLQSHDMQSCFRAAHTSHDGGGALHWAARDSAPAYNVPLLLQHGCDPFALDARGRTPVWRSRSKSVMEALLYCVRTREDFMKVWRRPAPFNADGRTLLMKLVTLSTGTEAPALDRLLSFCTVEDLNAVDHRGRTALSLSYLRAPLGSSTPLFLLERCCRAKDFNVRIGGCLHAAATQYDTSPFAHCQRLLSHGADLLERDSFGRTALHAALQRAAAFHSYYSNPRDIIILLQLFGDPTVLSTRDSAGRVPLHWLCVALCGTLSRLELSGVNAVSDGL
eukprot:TRINITY_DN999_c0_g1_i1.p1 TRINITY_DN999_c0_g1~~TRINITY_DN999_c0_g1_i1.p1  ORF type:complete len:689 (-),score=43.88 TRINITY_DN999_c0_g1_i1:17-2083(-)